MASPSLLATAAPPLSTPRSPGRAIVAICLILFMVNLDTSIVIVGLPSLVTTLHTTFAAAQWIVLSYLLALTALIAGAGRLGDLWGKKRLYLAGIAVFTTASLLCGLAGRIEWLLVWRAVQGVGAACCLALSFALASDLVPASRLGKSLGVLTMMVPLGIASGPACGGLLLATLGWQSMFLINLPLGLLAYGGVARFAPASAAASGPVRVDWGGMALLAATLGAYCLSMTQLEQHGLRQPQGMVLLGLAAGGLGWFVRHERRVAAPFLDVRLFRNGLLSASLAASLLVYIVIITATVLLPFYLTKACQLPPVQVGLLLSFGPLVTAALSIPAGALADRLGARQVMLAGVLVMVAGCLAVSTLTPALGAVGFLWRVGLLYVGLTLFQTPNNTAVMALAEPAQRGLLSGLLSLSRTMGHITGTAVIGALFAFLVQIAGRQPLEEAGAPAVTTGLQQVFWVAALLAGLAALLLARVLRHQQPATNAS